jgi:UDP:flavonoid glycosyltransferase YjiC (YdhE family)
MSEPHADRFWDTAAAAFLRRRLHNRRMRAAAVRGLKQVSAGEGSGLHMEFDEADELFARVPTWMEGYTADCMAAPASEVPHLPRLTIVIMVVGSRGDVQPFIPIGRRFALRHRVRLATHREFRSVVEQAGLEFFPLAGDPHELMEYMVKTGGRIVPTRIEQFVEDVPKKRAMVAEILASTWRACTEPDPDHPGAPPFRADLIIANPPSYGHIHCAEALCVPLHMIFTMPWSPTSAFPHPLARLPPGEHRPVRNYLSYAIADLLAWSGIGDLVNEFREQTLGLPPVALADGGALLEDNEVPFTYLWPASLVPKPPDWGPHIDLANFIVDDAPHSYEPPRELLDFLAGGEAPIYVGFGSTVVDDPAALSRTIFAALDQAAARGIVSEGWAHLGGAAMPANVYLVGDCPHDWLFARCRAVCHHGGAGTTAAGLRAGLPTVVVPFFGDQFFWGQVIAAAGAGPQPIPIDRLDADTLAAAFDACAGSEMRDRARALGAKVCESKGVDLVAQSLYCHLPVRAMLCARDPEHLATRYCDTCALRLCEPCCATHHAGHAAKPYRFVDWGARLERGIAHELSDLIADAAQALRAGIEELTPGAGPRQRGVVFGDVEPPPDEEAEGPVRKLARWLRGA